MLISVRMLRRTEARLDVKVSFYFLVLFYLSDGILQSFPTSRKKTTACLSGGHTNTMKSGVYQFLLGCFVALGSFLFGYDLYVRAQIQFLLALAYH